MSEVQQPALFESQIQQRFLDYHSKNPHVYVTLRRLALEAVQRGQRHIGAKMLWEVMRWNLMMETSDPEGWKLNNNYCSRYARMLMDQNSDLAGVFETRELRA